MGYVDDYLGGYENLAMHDGDWEAAYYSQVPDDFDDELGDILATLSALRPGKAARAGRGGRAAAAQQRAGGAAAAGTTSAATGCGSSAAAPPAVPAVSKEQLSALCCEVGLDTHVDIRRHEPSSTWHVTVTVRWPSNRPKRLWSTWRAFEGVAPKMQAALSLARRDAYNAVAAAAEAGTLLPETAG
jgi:hypothetical protein